MQKCYRCYILSFSQSALIKVWHLKVTQLGIQASGGRMFQRVNVETLRRMWKSWGECGNPQEGVGTLKRYGNPEEGVGTLRRVWEPWRGCGNPEESIKTLKRFWKPWGSCGNPEEGVRPIIRLWDWDLGIRKEVMGPWTETTRARVRRNKERWGDRYKAFWVFWPLWSVACPSNEMRQNFQYSLPHQGKILFNRNSK